ncbi:MAG TPA: MgtC/SapB family protein [Acidimicrobiales bacterium]|nr:MgtC/SapB family protein [Acidimicrobiales bacterium]
MELTAVELLGRLFLAAVLGLVVGVERDSSSRGAGGRTHALVALGAALFTIAGAYGFGDIERTANVDPARIAAQVATGVGFIGAGAIIRNGTSVQGVTTAATVWLAASIGVVCAAGGYIAAFATTGLALLVLVVLRSARPLVQRFGRFGTVMEVEYRRGHGTLGPLLRSLDERDGRVQQIAVEDDEADATGDGVRHVSMHVSVRRPQDLDQILEEVGRRPEILAMRVGAGETD